MRSRSASPDITAFRRTPDNVLGVLSLIFWSLNFIVSFKYVSFVLRADNRGEGGILALLALVRPRRRARGCGRLLVALGLFGAALLYGDGVITPGDLGARRHRGIWPWRRPRCIAGCWPLAAR